MNLFKLKKDGKRIGYLKIEGGIAWISFDGSKWYQVIRCLHFPKTDEVEWIGIDAESHRIAIRFDSEYPYVTDDKNGDKVFKDDKVKFRPSDIDNICGEEQEDILTADVSGGFWCFDVEGSDFIEASNFKDIELLKDKDE